MSETWKFETLSVHAGYSPDPTTKAVAVPIYHGVIYTEALGPAAYIGRARVVPLRNTGAAISPFNAFLILQGIETLALRMERITDNTLKVAWVNYAGLHHAPPAVARGVG